MPKRRLEKKLNKNKHVLTHKNFFVKNSVFLKEINLLKNPKYRERKKLLLKLHKAFLLSKLGINKLLKLLKEDGKKRFAVISLAISIALGNPFYACRVLNPSRFEELEVLESGKHSSVPRYIFEDIFKRGDFIRTRVDGFRIEFNELKAYTYIFGDENLFIYGPDYHLFEVKPVIVKYKNIVDIKIKDTYVSDSPEKKIKLNIVNVEIKYKDDKGNIKKAYFVPDVRKCYECELFGFLGSLFNITTSKNPKVKEIIEKTIEDFLDRHGGQDKN